MRQRQEKVLELLETHGRPLHRLLARLTRCEHATSDLMQDLFLRLSRAKGFGKARDPYAYAWKAAVNLAFEWRRRRKPPHEPLRDGSAPQTEQSALTRMIRDEQVERVLEAASRLDELARNVVLMRFVEQESYENIALRLGRNPAYLRALCSKSLARLRTLCAADGDGVDKGVRHG